jgi:DNA-binding MarR family transcriptional regulator
MSRPVIPSQPDFLVQLRRTQHAVRLRLDAELGATGLTTPQYTVLAALERAGELSASDLAREFGMSAQTINVLVKGLEACGFLRRSRHPAHGRILLASLTAAGRRALKRGRAVACGVETRVLSGLRASDRRMLMRQLQAIEQNSPSPLRGVTVVRVAGFPARAGSGGGLENNARYVSVGASSTGFSQRQTADLRR